MTIIWSVSPLIVAKQIEQFNKQDQENIKLSAMDR